MKTKDINIGLDAIEEAIDFVASNTDGDCTGIGGEMIDRLSIIKEALHKERAKIYLKNALIKLKKRNK